MCGAIVSIAMMAWLISGSAFYRIKEYTPLPTSIDGCDALTTASALIETISTTVEAPTAETFSFYSMSFQWYPFVGTLITWLVGIGLSHTMACNEQPVDASLLSPWVRWMLPEAAAKPSHTEMQLMSGSLIHSGSDGVKRLTVVSESIYAVR